VRMFQGIADSGHYLRQATLDQWEVSFIFLIFKHVYGSFLYHFVGMIFLHVLNSGFCITVILFEHGRISSLFYCHLGCIHAYFDLPIDGHVHFCVGFPCICAGHWNIMHTFYSIPSTGSNSGCSDDCSFHFNR